MPIWPALCHTEMHRPLRIHRRIATVLHLCMECDERSFVQVTHKIGTGDMQGARAVLRQSLTATLVFSLLLAVLGAAISGMLPGWLGGDVSIHRDASLYFFIFSLFLPALQMIFLQEVCCVVMAICTCQVC